MKPVLIFGASQFADLVHYYLTQDAAREVVAFAVDPQYIVPDRMGLPVVSFEDVEKRYPPRDFDMFIALGPHRVNSIRAARYEAALAKGYELVSYVSPRAATWPDLVYGPNTLVTETSLLMPFVTLGANVVLFGARIGHHSRIGDHCMLSGATLGGGVTVGERTFMGINASVKEQLHIGQRNVIGAGAVILRSTHDGAVHAVPHSRASRVPSSRLRVV